MMLAGLDSNQRRTQIQSLVAPADRATGHRSPSPVSSWASCPYRGRPDAGPKGIVRSAGVEPATSGISGQPLCLLEYEHMEPPPGADPGSPALRGRGRSRARRQSWPSWPRTRKLRVQSPAGLPNSPNGHRYGRRESNPQPARFGLAASALGYARVRRHGLEP